MEGEKKEATLSKREILSYTLKKIDYQLSRNVVADKELYDIYKYFFSNYYNLEYEFSADELSKELDKLYIEQNVRQYYDYIISRISIIEFKDDSLTEEEIREILGILREVVVYLTNNSSPTEKKQSFFSGFAKLLRSN